MTTWAKTHAPITEIRNLEHWGDPHRLIKYKKLYFTLGLDSQPLRRSAVITGEKRRTRNTFIERVRGSDPTGFDKARRTQIRLWKRRMHYQEYYLQHLFTRHVWGLLRTYPVGGAKIAGFADRGYFGYDQRVPIHRYTHQPLPANAAHLYPRRK